MVTTWSLIPVTVAVGPVAVKVVAMLVSTGFFAGLTPAGCRAV